MLKEDGGQQVVHQAGQLLARSLAVHQSCSRPHTGEWFSTQAGETLRTQVVEETWTIGHRSEGVVSLVWLPMEPQNVEG